MYGEIVKLTRNSKQYKQKVAQCGCGSGGVSIPDKRTNVVRARTKLQHELVNKLRPLNHKRRPTIDAFHELNVLDCCRDFSTSINSATRTADNL